MHGWWQEMVQKAPRKLLCRYKAFRMQVAKCTLLHTIKVLTTPTKQQLLDMSIPIFSWRLYWTRGAKNIVSATFKNVIDATFRTQKTVENFKWSFNKLGRCRN